MKDKEFLMWLADRLVHVYHESPCTDFVTKLVSIAIKTPPDQETKNLIGAYDAEKDTTNKPLVITNDSAV